MLKLLFWGYCLLFCINLYLRTHESCIPYIWLFKFMKKEQLERNKLKISYFILFQERLAVSYQNLRIKRNDGGKASVRIGRFDIVLTIKENYMIPVLFYWNSLLIFRCRKNYYTFEKKYYTFCNRRRRRRKLDVFLMITNPGKKGGQ